MTSSHRVENAAWKQENLPQSAFPYRLAMVYTSGVAKNRSASACFVAIFGKASARLCIIVAAIKF
ncbi:hypothetical protein B7W85_03780 [Allorhizobium ampelinum]|nr:hypothetical protein BBL07_19090 [Agrobacterium vitis]OVE96318.1 hypothetical protein B7W85_03780 [Allorhizobium ampelinum]